MFVVKRNNACEEVSFDKVLTRLRKLSSGLDVNYFEVAQKVCTRIYDGVKTCELDELAAQICSSQMVEHPDYGELAVRVAVSNHQKNTSPSFSETVTLLYENVDNSGRSNPLVSRELYDIAMLNKEKLNSSIKYDRDYLFDYFGFRTLEKAYLLRIGDRVIERPQHMWMRVALGIHGSDVKDALATYELMSTKHFVHATPTLFNAGTPVPQMSSCFVEDTEVVTVNAGVKRIQDVALGDRVVTHTGCVKQVTQLHRNPLGARSVHSLKVSRSKELFVTGNHRLWTARKGALEATWVSVDDLAVGDYVGMPCVKTTCDALVPTVIDILDWLPKGDPTVTYDELEVDGAHAIRKGTKYSHNNLSGAGEVAVVHKSNPVARHWSLDQDFANFIGMYLGDGNLITTRGRAYGISFTVHSANKPEIDFIVGVGERVLGVKHSIHNVSKQNVIQVQFNSCMVGAAFLQLFGKGFAGKRLPALMFSQPRHVILGLLAGLLTTDGCIAVSGATSLQMSNEVLMDQLYHLFRMHGMEVSYIRAPPPKQPTHTQAWQMHMPFDPEVIALTFKHYPDGRVQRLLARKPTHLRGRYSPLKLGKHKFLRVESNDIITDLRPEFVYTLGVEEDHSYAVEGLLAENCYLYSMHDSIDGIFSSLRDCAQISKYAGGIGLHIHNIRARNSVIRGTNGISSGILPMLRVFNNAARYVNQSGRRNGSIAMYLEPWHADIECFLDMRKNHGNEEERARDLFYALWIPDLFMKRVKANEMWSLMCPDACPGLSDTFGEDFETLYTSYESEKRYVKQVRAQDLWFQVLQNQIETGTPYMLYKDHVNRKNNQSNLGVIKSLNLCCEICEYSDATTCAVCNLASLVLPTFVINGKFDFEKFHVVVKTIVKNLNKVIDRNFYPIEQARFSNTRDRPIGIGVQGLADVFALLKLPFESQDARALNRQIFECMYFAALEESNILAQKHGAYQTFPGSPASKGVLQFDMWGVTPSTTYDWERLREQIECHGLRNSLLIAPMPTASTAQIMGSTEAFEPLTSNLYKRKTLAGEFIVVNKYLVADLRKLGLWTKEVRQQIIVGDGSIQHITEIPEELRALYKTVWEVKMRSVIDMAADRGAFVDQSQSMNLFVEAPDYPKLTSMHFYAWEKGLKTGMYYLRSKARAKVQKFTVDPSLSAGNLAAAPSVVEDTSQAVCESCSA